MAIKENVIKIQSELNEVQLIVATKTQPITKIQDAISAGIEIIGENYVQEAIEKYEALKGKVKFHLIGHLQANKVKKAVVIFDMIQTVDSIKLANEIDKRCKEINKVMPILIEVNIGREENKSGCMPEDLPMLAEEMSKLKNIKIEGLMTMAPYFKDNEKVRHFFKDMKKIYDILKLRYNFRFLSMGMSQSYKVAIEEGSNMVRLGTVIFGERL